MAYTVTNQQPLSRILAVLICASALPLVILAAWMSYIDVVQYKNATHARASGLADNMASSLDNFLDARIRALGLLAESPNADDPADWQLLYQSALVYLDRFDTHVIFAGTETPTGMRFNTRLPFGSTLPLLPVPAGRVAAQEAIRSGQPAVGDTFVGPVANETLVALAVPGVRAGEVQHILLSTLSSRQLQQHIDDVSIPDGWAATLLDSNGAIVAQRAPDGFQPGVDADPAEQFRRDLSLAPWVMAIEIPRNLYQSGLQAVSLTVLLAIALATLSSIIGGVLTARHISRQVAALADPSGAKGAKFSIREIVEVNRQLEDRTASLIESESRHRKLFENNPLVMWVYDLESLRFVAVNEAAILHYGYSREEFLAMTIRDIRPPEDVPKLIENVNAVTTGLDNAGQWRHIAKDGRILYVDITSHTLMYGDRKCELVLVNDITDRMTAEAQLNYMNQHDALTDLPNRLLLMDRLTVAIASNKRSGLKLAVLLLNLDRFKNVNDAFGHLMGDKVLRELADRLATCLRQEDTLSRMGGDEFLILLPRVPDEQNAAFVAQKLLCAISEPMVIDHHHMVISGFIGIACSPEHGLEPDVLLRNVASAAHMARNAGQDRYLFYTPDMSRSAEERISLESDLHQAIERDQLFLVYQPQVSLGTRMVVGAEALIRWQHPELGVISPARFIPIAEESGQIVGIGRWVLETACRQQAWWISQDKVFGTISVNVSAHQFSRPDFVDMVFSVLDESGLDSTMLELELTESVVMHDLGDVLNKLQLLSSRGIKLAIDDFGTGYSSLSYLNKFPLNRLKIDQSFVRTLTDSGDSRTVIRSIIRLGHSLGLSVIAEGIETHEQQDILGKMDCNDGQGYLYSKPVTEQEFPDVVVSIEAALRQAI